MNIYSIPPLFSLICFLGLGAVTIKKGRWQRWDILFFILCLLGCLLYIDVLLVFWMKSPQNQLLVRRAGYVFLVYLFPVYLHFFYAYLEVKTKRWLIPAAYAYAFCLMWVTQSPLFIPAMKQHYFGWFPLGGPLYSLFGLISLAVMLEVVILTFRAIKNARNAFRKNQLKYLLAGIGLLGILNVLNFLPIMGFSVYPPGNLSFIPLVIFGIGLFKHDLQEWGGFLRKGIVYTLLTLIFTLLYVLVAVAAKSLSSGYDFSRSIYFYGIFFLFVAVIYGPVNKNVKATVDHVLNRGKIDYQKTLKDVSHMITSVLDVHEVVRQITSTIKQTMQIEHAFLYLSKPSGSGFKNYDQISGSRFPVFIDNSDFLVSALKKRKKSLFKTQLKMSATAHDEKAAKYMDGFNAELAVPMILHDRLNGFLLLEEKNSGDVFTEDDIDLLETLAVQGALAVENARAYGKITELNRDLEKKVDLRTRELKTALVEKEKTQEQLIRSESLAAIGQLVAGTAHELNNPLASVSSILQSSILDLKSNPPASDRVDETFMDDLLFAQKELKRAGDIVKSLLGLSRQTQTFGESIDMNAVVRDALRILHNQYKNQDLRIVEDYGTDLPKIYGNFSNLGQVILNIIQNSIQAIGHNSGEINIQTGFDANAGCVVVCCTDNGPGIPEKLRQDIFKPFFTTKPVGEGTGLGLYICHEIIRKHKGELTLSDNNGQGSKFMVRLPVSDA